MKNPYDLGRDNKGLEIKSEQCEDCPAFYQVDKITGGENEYACTGEPITEDEKCEEEREKETFKMRPNVS